MSKTRIYLVTSAHAGDRLVRATSAAQAIRHAAIGTFKANVATQEDLIRTLPSQQVEDAREEAQA